MVGAVTVEVVMTGSEINLVDREEVAVVVVWITVELVAGEDILEVTLVVVAVEIPKTGFELVAGESVEVEKVADTGIMFPDWVGGVLMLLLAIVICLKPLCCVEGNEFEVTTFPGIWSLFIIYKLAGVLYFSCTWVYGVCTE